LKSLQEEHSAVLPKYEYVEHTADLGFRAYGTSPELLFANAAEALFEVLVSLETIRPKEERIVEVEAPGFDALMVSWLNELLYLFDTEGLLLKLFEIKRIEEDYLRATVCGEFMDPARHEIRTGIKAVTYHKLYVRKNDGMWETQVIVDL